jgi:hypothetical protein
VSGAAVRRRPVVPGLCLLAAALLGAGCGDDDDDTTASTTSGDPPARTVTVPAPTATEEAPERTGTAPAETEEGRRPASPEDQPGGAGDEEAARSEVVLTGRGGRIGPLVVKVPPFIAIRVVLRSGDGKPYVIRFGRRILRAGLKDARSSATFDGLRPGRRLRGAAVSGRVVIEASAEPGP